MRTILSSLLSWLPVIFGVGFLGPVIAAFLLAVGIDAVLEFPSIQVGLAVGFIWGFAAKLTGRWI